jgi:hypothetical protein
MRCQTLFIGFFIDRYRINRLALFVESLHQLKQITVLVAEIFWL